MSRRPGSDSSTENARQRVMFSLKTDVTCHIWCGSESTLSAMVTCIDITSYFAFLYQQLYCSLNVSETNNVSDVKQHTGIQTEQTTLP